MIREKLEKLGEYIDKIDGIKPIELLENYMREIEQYLKIIPSDQLEIGDEFNKYIYKIIKEYIKNGTSKYVIICQLYNILIKLIRKDMIETQAESLGIDRKMFKDEMNLLFKGKKYNIN